MNYCTAGHFRGLKFSRIGRFWIFAVNIFAVVSTPWTHPLLASIANTRDPGIKIFAVNIFVDCDQAAKSVKILTCENFQLYGSVINNGFLS